MDTGYIKLYRKILDNPIIFKDSDHVAIWIYLLLNATHKPTQATFKGKKIILKSGQVIVGSKSISEELNIHYVKVHRILEEFIDEKQIEKQASNKNSLITVLNWEKYQVSEKQNEKQEENPKSDEKQNEKQKNSTSPVFIGLCEDRNTTDEKQNEISLKNKNQHVEQKCEKQNEKQKNSTNSIITECCEDMNTTSEKQNEKQKKEILNFSENKQEYYSNYYSYLNKIYAREINPAEKDFLNELLRDYDKELVKEAIKESAIANVKNLKYVKGTLKNWKKDKINNLEDLKKHKEEEEEKEEKQPVELFSYNWLEDNE